nr:hypothetical protein [Pontibacterium sinense]
MDENFRNEYLQITPAGAYYATVSSEPDDARALLLQLLSAEIALPYSEELIEELTDLDQEQASDLFNKLREKGFVELNENPVVVVDEVVEKMLPELLPLLSNTGRVALADDQGFCLGASGFDDTHAEALSALAADVISLHERHLPLLNRELSFSGESWGMLDPIGQSQVGFWVVHMGSQKFMLIVDEMPKLNQQAFVNLLSVLARRYLDY